MNLTIDINKLAEAGRNMAEMAEYFNISLENLQWKMGLPLYEQFILRDEQNIFMMKILGLNEDDFHKYLKIRDTSMQLEKFYNEEIKYIKNEINLGVQKENIPFDITLTKEQAYEKYCHCDMVTANKIVELLFKAETKAAFHEKDIRTNYKGDLAAQLGVDKAKYLEEEKDYNAKMKVTKERMEELMNKPEIKEGMSAFRKAFGDYSDMAKKVSEEYGRTR